MLADSLSYDTSLCVNLSSSSGASDLSFQREPILHKTVQGPIDVSRCMFGLGFTNEGIESTRIYLLLTLSRHDTSGMGL